MTMPPAELTRRQFGSFLGALPAFQTQSTPPRLRRADSFFGLHFDLHPNAEDKVLGRDVNEAMVEHLLDATRPDFVQYDSKGHPGWLGWPSQVGPSAPGIVTDSLAVWRRVTARRGVALYTHFSGVWDSEAVRRRPEWARVDADGKPDPRQTSTYGPYVDELMLPQLHEAVKKYALDGVWIDGECWATNPDYCAAAVKAFGRPAPKDAKDPLWQQWLEFNRDQFRRYIRHYVTALHQSHPGFQVASNWLYSTMVPEEPTLPVDFLSGDYLGNASISTARLEARYLAQTGRSWDLMAWGFQQADSNSVGHIHKPAVQLEQEASVVLAQGGGFQIYYVPSRAGHFEEAHIQTMAEVGRYCRTRQAACFKSETVPQIGVVFSGHSLYRTSGRLFGGWGKRSDPARGWLDLLLACGWSVDVIPDWKLSRVAAQYPFLVLPDWAEPGDTTIAQLKAYARKGGRLLVAGAANAARFAADAGARVVGEPSEQPAFLKGSVLANLKGLWQDLEPAGGTLLAERYAELDTRSGGRPAAVSHALGDGRLIVVPGPVGSVYAATHAAAVRDFAHSLVAPHFKPLVALDGPPVVELALRRQAGRLAVHLLNQANMQVAGDFATTDYVPPVGPVRLRLGPAKPFSVIAEPGGRPLQPVERNGEWVVELAAVALHEIITIQG